MEHLAMFVGIWGLLTYFSGLASLDERKRALEDEADYCKAGILDTGRKISLIQVPRSKKRKRDGDLNEWKGRGENLMVDAQQLLGQAGSRRSFVMGAKMRWDVCKLVYKFKVHRMKGNVLHRQTLLDARGPCCGFRLPVNQLVGQLACRTLNQLKFLLEGDESGRIAMHGERGVGKTFLMKHLHNWALNKFDFVFWFPSPVEFTNTSVQDAITALVSCNFSSDDALSVRAKKLSDRLSELGSFAIFLDGVPKSDFSLEQVGIPVAADESKCKLVLTTSSDLEPRLLDGFKTVEIQCLPKEDAYELFLHKANIERESVSSLYGIPRLLTESCGGVPRMIENIATRICGIDDPHEWRNALFELEGLRIGMKKSRFLHLGENDSTSSSVMRLC